jgi:carboxylesterase type B
VDSPEAYDQWDAEKKPKWDAYRAKHVDEKCYVDASHMARIGRDREVRNPVFGIEAIKRRFQFFANEFFNRDLANEKFEDIVLQSPQLAMMYEDVKGREGQPLVPVYDRAPLSFLTSAARDVIFSCPSLEFAAAHRDAGNKVFFYNLAFDVWHGTIFYNVGMSVAGVKDGGDIAIADLGVFHGADIPLVFKLFKSKPTHLNDPNLFGLFHFFTGNQVSKQGDMAHQVADKMGCYWANLARCGDVNCVKACHGTQLGDWPHLSSTSHKFMNIGPAGQFEVKDHQQTGFAGVGANLPTNDQCDAWDKAEFRYLDIRYHNHKMRAGQHRYV